MQRKNLDEFGEKLKNLLNAILIVGSLAASTRT